MLQSHDSLLSNNAKVNVLVATPMTMTMTMTMTIPTRLVTVVAPTAAIITINRPVAVPPAAPMMMTPVTRVIIRRTM
jgi:hypothetical protein